MLQYSKFPQSVNLTAADHPARTITGRQLNQELKSASAVDRARLARKIEQGELQLLRLTRKQATGLAKVSAGYVGTLSRLSADERTQLARGQLSLSQAHRRRATDVEVDRIIARLGAEVIMAGLDRATAPARQVG
jgi:hypothetical protein